jgi:hypothetical protein
MTERDLEVDPADHADQQRAVTTEDDDVADDSDASLEVDPADRAEQQRTVTIDDDEYR